MSSPSLSSYLFSAFNTLATGKELHGGMKEKEEEPLRWMKPVDKELPKHTEV